MKAAHSKRDYEGFQWKMSSSSCAILSEFTKVEEEEVFRFLFSVLRHYAGKMDDVENCKPKPSI